MRHVFGFCLLVFGGNSARTIPQYRLKITSGLVDTCPEERERLTQAVPQNTPLNFRFLVGE